MLKTRIHWKSYLSDNILIKDDEDILRANHDGFWVLFGYVVITEDVEERLDKSFGPAKFVGHLRVRSKPFVLSPEHGCPDLEKIQNDLVELVDRLIADNKFSKSTEPPKDYEL